MLTAKSTPEAKVTNALQVNAGTLLRSYYKITKPDLVIANPCKCMMHCGAVLTVLTSQQKGSKLHFRPDELFCVKCS